jgi:heme/copper-type cytochrome/quinol oxidase subunit 3
VSTVPFTEAPTQAALQPLEIDQVRGKQGVRLFIATEAALFVMLYFAYFFLSRGDWRWLSQKPPKITYALIMLAVLITSSVVLRIGERMVERGSFVKGRIALVATILLGLGFLALSAFEYKEHLAELTPQMNAYGSIFYTITTFHVAHIILGLLMLTYVLLLPRVGRTDRPPHRAYSDAGSYWHFVDIVWVSIVGILYILPNIR